MSGIFGLLDLGTTPANTQTLKSRATRHDPSGCFIIADARIDYRAGLCKAMAIDNAPISDAEIILSAYLHWGDAFLERLVGDFAFALWDPRRQVLICARDHFGMRPLYYHHAPRRRFLFASDAREIVAVPDVPRIVNEGRIADFLVPELEWIDYTSTFFGNVYRLPPGHKLVVTPRQMSISEYWAPQPGPAPAAKSDRDWVDGLLEVLSRAVAERLPTSTGQAGCMLSGGMDSGSVAALASRYVKSRGAGPLRSFSAARRPEDDCEETRRLLATIAKLQPAATVLTPDSIADLDDELVASIEEPFDGDFLFMKAIFMAARDAGVEALLDGGGGDIVLNEGDFITRLIRKGRLSKASAEILAEQRFWGADRRYAELGRHLLKAASPKWLKKTWRRWRRGVGARRSIAAALIHRDLAQRVDVEGRFEQMQKMFPADRATDPAIERISKIRPNISAGRERYRRLAASAGLEARDPFLDLNVVRFCAHLPDHMLVRNGWPKYVLREAMAGTLPDEVRWGRGRHHVGWVFNQRFLEREEARGRLSLEGIENSLEGLVDSDALRQGWELFLQRRDPGPIHRAYVLSLWIAQGSTSAL